MKFAMFFEVPGILWKLCDDFSDDFLNNIANGINSVNSCNNLLIFADKRRNIYETALENLHQTYDGHGFKTWDLADEPWTLGHFMQPRHCLHSIYNVFNKFFWVFQLCYNMTWIFIEHSDNVSCCRIYCLHGSITSRLLACLYLNSSTTGFLCFSVLSL